jgi:hypothetical protein
MIPPVVLFCKSYSGDLLRAMRLVKSVGRYNSDGLSFFLSVPECDFEAFSSRLNELDTEVKLLTDQEIIRSNPCGNEELYSRADGRYSQQVIKSEFWRYWLLNNSSYEELVYVCIDSDSEFIRNFYRHNFVNENGTPFTVCHDNEDLLRLARLKKKHKVELNFRKDCSLMKDIFGREGPDYAFSPTPVIWSSSVWQDLDEYYLKPKKISLWNAILERPNEVHWYGEALLHFRPIPLLPIGPLFRVYHYDWEFFYRKKQGETAEKLKKKFLGVLRQSNWEYELDTSVVRQKKSVLSRLHRRLKRWITNIQN